MDESSCAIFWFRKNVTTMEYGGDFMLLHSLRGFRVEISIYIYRYSIHHIFLYQYHIIVVLKFGGCV